MTRDLGTKHTCFKCSSKFYDLHKPAPLCPKCGADQRESPAKNQSLARRARAKANADDEVPEIPKKLGEDDEEEEEAVIDEDAEELGE